jgi:hygromycin-B 7''-O-kinase
VGEASAAQDRRGRSSSLYRLYHALELWDWFASLGQTGQLDSLARDMRRIAVGD